VYKGSAVSFFLCCLWLFLVGYINTAGIVNYGYAINVRNITMRLTPTVLYAAPLRYALYKTAG